MGNPSGAPAEASSLATEITQLKQERSSSPERTLSLADALGAFVLALHPPQTYRPVIASICELATDLDPASAATGQRLLFQAIAEPLADAFDARCVRLYDEIFADVIEFCRHLPAAHEIDACLAQLRMHEREDMLARRRRTEAERRHEPGDAAPIRKVLVLSRVTIGADVAVASVVLQKMERVFPRAERCLVGSVAPELVLADDGNGRAIRHVYDRHGGLLSRLVAWVDLVGIVRREFAGLRAEECLVIDPDSRLTQLGLLPVVPDGIRYEFFDSRLYRTAGGESMAELTSDWLDQTFGLHPGDRIYPRASVRPDDRAQAAAIVGRLRPWGTGHVVAVNLGVGGNARKRIAGTFELELVRGLLSEGSTVILDHGTAEEVERIGRLVAALRQHGHHVADISGAHGAEAGRPVVATYRGAIGPFAALLSAADAYVGYDSAFQHIAAALRIPVVDIFVDPPNPVFSRRWRPASQSAVRAIEASSSGNRRDVVVCVLHECRALMEHRRPSSS